ncbi:DUF2272 domain-containing protein [Rhodovastum sp. RN2-1]|uniref:DUF2272 domain-containing protein n=1 Tax=Limobrevibacterium gyesilva TaxID=2991712 RepID=A0AA41YRG0_9PROT|nr:DUF2272 domain-containing protein [Limobrevibacterium gyesilva]
MVLTLAGCKAAPPGPTPPPAAEQPLRIPPFARVPYEPFGRADAVAMALREWRAWGQMVDDAPPEERPPPAPEDKPERMPGMWQRVGEYWWLSQDNGRTEAAWTGKHDDDDVVFDAGRDEDYAWSAAFVSYVMRMSGAGPRFPYSPSHVTYINIARQMSLGQAAGWVVWAEPIDTTAPQPGDLICYGRHNARRMRFADLPARHFPSHCDIVVSAVPGQLAVIGGNVDDAVTMKHVPVTAAGTLAAPRGAPLDTRYPWFVVIRVLYDR